MSMMGENSTNYLYRGIYQPHLMIHALNQNPERTVIQLTDDTIVTASEFSKMTSRYCQALESLGIKSGARVGVLSGNRREVLYLSSACLINKYIFVPFHSMGSLDDHIYIVEDSSLDVLVFDPSHFEARALKLHEARKGALFFLAFGTTQVGIDLCAAANTFIPLPLAAPLLNGDEPYRLTYSGGTTGKPKAIIGTYRTGLAVVTIQLAEWEWPSDVRQLLCTPLSHAGAAMFLPTLLRGGSMVVLPAFNALEVLEAIEKYRITCVLLVPTMIYAILDHPRLDEFDLSSIETIFYGGSAMSPTRLREGIAKLGKVFSQFYGQAEAPMTITVMRRDEHDPNDPGRLSSCGRPVPWVDVALLDQDCREVPLGEPGEICVRGPLVMAGYYNKPQETVEAFAGGWLHTGDVAVGDKAGFLRIVDRKKDMIITGGFNVYPREIEDVLGSHPSISAVAVIGVPDSYWGEAVKAIVVLKPESCADTAELIALVREKKGVIQAPKSIEFVSSIPLTPVGKPDKKALRATYAKANDEVVSNA